MNKTWHLSSAQEATTDIIDTISETFKQKPITIIVEEELYTTDYLMSTPANKAMLEKSIQQDKRGEHILVKHNNI